METPLSLSSNNPSKTIDDLTTALTSFSRAHTPDPQVACCCMRDNCESANAWAGLRAKLESRLVLSAEVGQALLERHEAYVRRQDAVLSRRASSVYSLAEFDESSSLQQHVEYLTKKLDTVTEENTLMESRLNELMIKHEMADASTRTMMRELQDARATIGRLSAQNARSVGWERRLEQITQERDDMRQERDSETHRARHAESKAVAFVEKCSKLQNEVHTLREEVYKFRASRDDFSKHVLQEARARLESLQHSLGRGAMHEDPETTIVLESLVADNEKLTRDVAELQNLLLESREDFRALREELDERRASAPCIIDEDATRVIAPPMYVPRLPAQGGPSAHKRSPSGGSGTSTLYGLSQAPHILSPSPHTPASTRSHRRTLSGNSQVLADDGNAVWYHNNFGSPHTRYPADLILAHSHPTKSPTQFGGERNHGVSPTIKPLLLLGQSQSRGVQTDPTVGYAYPSPRPSMLGVDRDSLPSTPPPEGRSDTSSISQQDPRTINALLERVAGLLLRMTQTDVKILTNRLKQQHLGAGDVGHVSRTTINGIVNEAAGLRAHIGSGKDDGVMMAKTDLKALLKIFRDTFAELGALREQLNEVVLDPAVAHRLRKDYLESERLIGDVRPSSAMGGWMAPIQKLFAPTPALAVPSTNVESTNAAGKPTGDLGRGRAPQRVVPKLAPAISATSATVNVEFASTGVRKIDISDDSSMQQHRVSSPVGLPLQSPPTFAPTGLGRPIAASYTSPTHHFMDIFAGAPQPSGNASSVGDAWVVLPRNDKGRSRQPKAVASTAGLGVNVRNGRGGGTIGRASLRKAHRLSRNVDAIIDQSDGDVPDFCEPLLERTLRPRGLSDSSIHTSFMKGEPSPSGDAFPRQEQSCAPYPHSQDTLPFEAQMTTPSTSPPARPAAPAFLDREHERSPVAGLGRRLAYWATAATGGLNDVDGYDSDFAAGSPRGDSILHASFIRRGFERRDY